VERIREYNLAQKALLKSLLPIEGQGEDHGAFVTLRDANAKALAAELEKEGIKTDARGEYLRICPDYLNSREELERAARHISRSLQQASGSTPRKP
jgi:kynureninase